MSIPRGLVRLRLGTHSRKDDRHAWPQQLHARRARQQQEGVGEQLAAYRRLAAAVGEGGPNGDAAAALEGFEAPLFNNMVIVLDRYVVHRVRNVTGKDGNPLNEVELLADSLMNNGGVVKGSNVIKPKPEESVLKLHIGDSGLAGLIV